MDFNLSFSTFRKYLPDKPNHSSHNTIKPRGMGIIFAFYSTIGFLLNGQIYFITGFILSLLGFIDDKINISARFKFFVNSYLLTF